MIKLFRAVRQRLLSENKFSKYMIYATGEIVLVVVGILIALSINNQNENNKNRVLEKDYLERMSLNIKADIKNIKASINNIKSRKKRSEFLLKCIEDPTLIEQRPSYFITSIEFSGYTNSPVITKNTFEEIKSSGKLSLIRNKKIKSKIGSYYAEGLSYQQYGFIYEDMQRAFLKNRMGILNSQQQIEMSSFSNDKNYSITEAKAVYKRMKLKTDYIQLIPIIIHGQIRKTKNLQSHLKRAIHLDSIIQIELNS